MDDKLLEGLARFCHKIAGAAPVAVPLALEDWAKPEFCFVNVQKKIEQDQGSMQLGWFCMARWPGNYWLRYNADSPRAAAMPRLRFSLRSFFLFLFFACLVGSNIFTAREVNRLRQENEKLRADLGLLVVSDPNKLHAIAVETHEVLTWRWRLHVPRGRTFEIEIATEEIPISGVPGPGSFVLPEGDMTVTAAIRRDHLGKWILNVAMPSGAIAMPVSDEHSQWIVESLSGSQELAGDGETEVMNPGEPMVLLRWRAMPNVEDGTSKTIPPMQIVYEPCDGVMIWIEEKP